MKKIPFFLFLVGYSIFVLMSKQERVLMADEKDQQIKLYNAITKQYDQVPLVAKPEKEWRAMLTGEEFGVTRKKGTEKAFSGKLLENKKEGVYVCTCCGTHLFSSETKFESGTGWPSFTAPIAEENMGTETDNSFFMQRTEVHCPRCGCHLGHIFDDGPAPTGKRYCINSVALKFQELEGGGIKP